MTRGQRRQMEATAWVIAAARRAVDEPGSRANNNLRRALNEFDDAFGATPKYALLPPERVYFCNDAECEPCRRLLPTHPEPPAEPGPCTLCRKPATHTTLAHGSLCDDCAGYSPVSASSRTNAVAASTQPASSDATAGGRLHEEGK